MRNFISEGDVVPYVNAGSAIKSGDPVAIPGIGVGVAACDIEATTGTGQLMVEGIFSLPKATGGGSAIAAKTRVYFDGTNITATKSTNTFAGFVTEDSGDSDATVNVCIFPGGDSDPGNLSQATVIAAIGATTNLPAPACAGAGSPSAANVDTAINTVAAVAESRLDTIEAKMDAVIAALKTANLMASS